MTCSSFLLLTLLIFAIDANPGVSPKQGRYVLPALDAESHRQFHEGQAEFRQGQRYAHGDGVDKDYSLAAAFYRRAAKKGFAPAAYSLACLYEAGQGVQESMTEAVVWYRKAAEQGDAQAQNNLGVLLATGNGVEKNPVEAVRWYRKAAEQNNPEGLTNLASMYLEGRGVGEEPTEAFALCLRAAKLGYPVAQNNVGLMFADGDGTDRNTIEAYAWLDVASDTLENSVALRDRLAKVMSKEQLEKAQARARELRAELAPRDGKPGSRD